MAFVANIPLISVFSKNDCKQLVMGNTSKNVVIKEHRIVLFWLWSRKLSMHLCFTSLCNAGTKLLLVFWGGGTGPILYKRHTWGCNLCPPMPPNSPDKLSNTFNLYLLNQNRGTKSRSLTKVTIVHSSIPFWISSSKTICNSFVVSVLKIFCKWKSLGNDI